MAIIVVRLSEPLMARRAGNQRQPQPPRPPRDLYRYGIGEWFGESFALMSAQRRKELANRQLLPRRDRAPITCPFQSHGGNQVSCNKESGVCTIREYRKVGATGNVEIATGPSGSLRAVCPGRFIENRTIFQWIGETILGHPNPMVVNQVNFLQRMVDITSVDEDPDLRDVGRIDHVLVHPVPPPFEWCALEIQAVYFSGDGMGPEFIALGQHPTEAIPFPVGRRRPDDRSSGPKRLMPQLQTKVPSLRRWGKKMAVVIDEGFYAALGRMEPVQHVSNCDIAWFVVKFTEGEGRVVLTRGPMHLTTLERSVEGLTGGDPVSREEFESRIREKLGERPTPAAEPNPTGGQ